MESVGKRLKRAIQEWGSIRRFSQEMRKTGVRGFSYQRIHDYLADRRSPSIDFLITAGDILGVRAAWIMIGEGPMRDLEVFVDESLSQRDRLGRSELPFVAREVVALGITQATELLFRETVTEIAASALDPDEVDDALIGLIARDLFVLLRLPRHLWGFRTAVPVRLQNQYMVAMLLALRLVIAEPRGHFVADYSENQLEEALRLVFEVNEATSPEEGLPPVASAP